MREKLGSGWVGQAPTRILIFWGNFVFFRIFCVVFMFQNVSKKTKKLDNGMGGWCLNNPSFSRIFGFFLLDKPPQLSL